MSAVATEALADGAVLLRGFVPEATRATLRGLIGRITAAAPFRHYETPGGRRMSVAMTASGAVGWVSDRLGYRYAPTDPTTGHAWPDLPSEFRRLAADAADAAGFPDFQPDTCLVNRYETGTGLSLHQDRDEPDASAPIVSVSLGLAATFLWGGLRRADAVRRVPLFDGDVVVWGGASRRAHHGVARLAPPASLLDAETCRFNLTFRRASDPGAPRPAAETRCAPATVEHDTVEGEPATGAPNARSAAAPPRASRGNRR